MAKLKSLIKIEGTLDDLTFYKGTDGYLVRTKGGVSAKRIKNDPAFARTRENGVEFGHSANSGKQLRRAILPLLLDAKDGLVTSRLTQVMSQIKNADATSLRGERKVHIGLTSALGKQALKGFEFNDNANIANVLLTDFTLDTATGEIEILDFSPMLHVFKPEGATHLSLTAGFLNLDFSTEVKDLKTSPAFNMAIDATVATVNLTPTSPATGTGNELYFLKVAFFQQVNSIQYPLKNGAFNALQLVEVL